MEPGSNPRKWDYIELKKGEMFIKVENMIAFTSKAYVNVKM